MIVDRVQKAATEIVLRVSRPGGDRPRGGGGQRGGQRGGQGGGGRLNFEDKLNRFMKDSEDRLSALKRNDAKRGGRGGRRG